MRSVKLITGVNVEMVLCDRMDSLEVRIFNPNTSSPCYDTTEVLNTSVKVQVVPIKHWVNRYYKSSADVMPHHIYDKAELVTEEDYIAVSPELDETLGKYIRIIASECEMIRLQEQNTRHFLELSQKNLETVCSNIDDASLWKRLKYLFTRRMKIE